MQYGDSTDRTFWNRMREATDGSGCWEWQGGKDQYGFGRIIVFGRSKYAHRVAYRLAVAPVPDEFYVLQSCGNRACCKPNHLYLGTWQDVIAKRDKAKHKTEGTATPKSEHALPYTKEELLCMNRANFIKRREQWDMNFCAIVEPLIAARASWREIGRAVGLSGGTVHQHAVRLGLHKPRSGNYAHAKLSCSQVQEAAARLQAGEDMDTICRRHNSTYNTLYYALKRYGFVYKDLRAASRRNSSNK